jgi:hypothetical protein
VLAEELFPLLLDDLLWGQALVAVLHWLLADRSVLAWFHFLRLGYRSWEEKQREKILQQRQHDTLHLSISHVFQKAWEDM